MASNDPDWEAVRKFRSTLPQVYKDWCICHLCQLLRLDVDIWKSCFDKATTFPSEKKTVVAHLNAVDIEYLIQQLKRDLNLKTLLLFGRSSKAGKARTKQLKKLIAERRFVEIEAGHFIPCDFADVLKRRLRDLREPLLPSALSVIFCHIQGLVIPELEESQLLLATKKQQQAICILFLILPEENYLLIRELLLLLHKTHLLRKYNDMDALSLAICFAPVVIRSRKFTLTEFNRNSSDAVWMLEFMIKNAPSLFVVPQQLVEDIKIQLSSRKWYLNVHQQTGTLPDQRLCKEPALSTSSSSSSECTEPTIEVSRFKLTWKSQKHSKLPSSTRSGTEKKQAHKFLCTSKSWRYNDLRGARCEEDVEPSSKSDQTPSVAPCSTEEQLSEVSKSEFFTPPCGTEQLSKSEFFTPCGMEEVLPEGSSSELFTPDQGEQDLESTLKQVHSESFWSKHTLRKLFPAKERKNKSLTKKKRMSWFSERKDKENMKMPPGGHAGSERNLNSIRTYRPSAVEVQNRVVRGRRDVDHNQIPLLPKHLTVQSVAKVESRLETYQTLEKKANYAQVATVNSNLSKNTGVVEDLSNATFASDDGWVMTCKDSPVSVYRSVFQMQEDRDWFESLGSPLEKIEDFKGPKTNSPTSPASCIDVEEDTSSQEGSFYFKRDPTRKSTNFADCSIPSSSPASTDVKDSKESAMVSFKPDPKLRSTASTFAVPQSLRVLKPRSAATDLEVPECPVLVSKSSIKRPTRKFTTFEDFSIPLLASSPVETDVKVIEAHSKISFKPDPELRSTVFAVPLPLLVLQPRPSGTDLEAPERPVLVYSKPPSLKRPGWKSTTCAGSPAGTDVKDIDNCSKISIKPDSKLRFTVFAVPRSAGTDFEVPECPVLVSKSSPIIKCPKTESTTFADFSTLAPSPAGSDVKDVDDCSKMSSKPDPKLTSASRVYKPRSASECTNWEISKRLVLVPVSKSLSVKDPTYKFTTFEDFSRLAASPANAVSEIEDCSHVSFKPDPKLGSTAFTDRHSLHTCKPRYAGTGLKDDFLQYRLSESLTEDDLHWSRPKKFKEEKSMELYY